MKQELKNKFPQWTKQKGNYNTILSNDIDSRLACAIEQVNKGYSISHFYDFEGVYNTESAKTNNLIGIDLALHRGKCWDNHCIRIGKDDYVNPQTANLNAIYDVSKQNYTDKFCMSTAIMMWSFYDMPLPETKLGKMLLLAIDTGHKGHYDSRYKAVHTKYLEMLGYEELIDLLNNTKSSDYYDLIREYKLYEHIYIDDKGYLQTELPLAKLQEVFNLPLELPKEQFQLRKEFVAWNGKLPKDKTKKDIDYPIISFAMTGSNFCNLTYIKKENEDEDHE